MRAWVRHLPPWLWPLSLGICTYLAAAFVLAHWLEPRPERSITLNKRPARLVLSRDGSLLLTYTHETGDHETTSLQLWDCTSGQSRLALREIQGTPKRAALSPDGRLIAVVVHTALPNKHFNLHLHLYDANLGTLLHRLLLVDEHGVFAGELCFSPDGRTLAYTIDLNGKEGVGLWDVPTMQTRLVLAEAMAPVVFSPDSQILAVLTPPPRCSVIAFDVTTGKERLSLDHPPIAFPKRMEWTRFVSRLAFTRDGSRLGVVVFLAEASNPDDAGGKSSAPAEEPPSSLVRLWDMRSGQVAAERLLPRLTTVATDTGQADWEGVFAMREAPPASQSCLDDPVTGIERLRVDVSDNLRGQNPTADGRALAISLQRGSEPPWRTFLARYVPWVSLPNPPVRSLVALYDVEGQRVLATLTGHNHGFFSPDGARLITFSDGDGRQLHIWCVPPRWPWLRVLGYAMIPSLVMTCLALVWRWRFGRRRTVELQA